jgi:subtilisin family serine protease
MAEANGFDKPNGSNGSGNGKGGHHPGYTGRFLISFEPGSAGKAASLLKDKAGLSALGARDAGAEAASSENMVFEEIGAAVVSALPDQQRALMAAVADSSVPITLMEPERVVWAAMLGNAVAHGSQRVSSLPPPRRDSLDGPVVAPPALPSPGLLSADYLRGYTAALRGMLSGLEGGISPSLDVPRDLEAAAMSATWGLQITRVIQSAQSGHGIRVAVLDTGMDLHHPDFEGRIIVSRSFIPGEAVQDGHGHGTHCIGVSCGPRDPAGTQRYGVAYGAEIYVGKVLSNGGSGADGGILAGINWAVQNKCQIVSMSLGSAVDVSEPFSQTYQNAARIAEQKGTLIVAAAGNESNRPGYVAPVGHPANCPTIVAVAALDSALRVARFSCGGVNGDGGEVNLAAPGVDVFSSWPMPLRYNTISGTSMATPCVAGILALYAEATGLRGLALANFVLKKSRRLSSVRDFGWGLVQAV